MNRRNLLLGISGAVALGALAACKNNSTVDLATAQKWAAALQVAAVNALADVSPKLTAAQQAQAQADLTALEAAVMQFQAVPPGGQGTVVAQQVLTLGNQFLGDVPQSALSSSASALVANIQLGLTVLASFVGAAPLASPA